MEYAHGMGSDIAGVAVDNRMVLLGWPRRCDGCCVAGLYGRHEGNRLQQDSRLGRIVSPVFLGCRGNRGVVHADGANMAPFGIVWW